MNEILENKAAKKIFAVLGISSIFAIMAFINPNSPALLVLGGLGMFVIFAHIYFIPSFIAHHRGHHQMMPIFLINLFLGWSLIGWVAALVWATVALDRDTNNA